MKAYDITKLTADVKSSEMYGTKIKSIILFVVLVDVATGSTYRCFGKKIAPP